uniref:Ribosomal RNA small subunit methyltransferase G n=1 Tax=Lygus hesperus TaxID=30085 RepID=A0A0A9XGW6_LYGHE
MAFQQVLPESAYWMLRSKQPVNFARCIVLNMQCSRTTSVFSHDCTINLFLRLSERILDVWQFIKQVVFLNAKGIYVLDPTNKLHEPPLVTLVNTVLTLGAEYTSEFVNTLVNNTIVRGIYYKEPRSFIVLHSIPPSAPLLPPNVHWFASFLLSFLQASGRSFEDFDTALPWNENTVESPTTQLQYLNTLAKSLNNPLMMKILIKALSNPIES